MKISIASIFGPLLFVLQLKFTNSHKRLESCGKFLSQHTNAKEIPLWCSSEIAVELNVCTDEAANKLAKKYGFKNLGRVGSLECFYTFRHKNSRRKKRAAEAQKLNLEPEVVWSAGQNSLKRVKRDFISHEDVNPANQNIEAETLNSRFANVREPSVPSNSHDNIHSYIDLSSVDSEEYWPTNNISRSKRAVTLNGTKTQLPWPDPWYNHQWYLRGGAAGGYDMRVREVWEMGFSGKNVSVSILDDGIQPDHPDLVANYDPMASYDVNDRDHDPTPRDNGNNKHGTRCAGEVSSMAGNGWCGVGIAYDSKIGGVRLLDGRISDSVEARSLSHNQHHIDIYSASWGPDDDGSTLDGPGRQAKSAFYQGVRKGRGGRGNIFIWASGNGGAFHDSCSYDGYTTSIFTLSISSTDVNNRPPWYLERCPATLATTYSSGSSREPAVVTTDMPNSCTSGQTGTSASAPMAAGIVALALEANPNLTWRDVQHLVVKTSDPSPLLGNEGWTTTASGRRFSNAFGYGLMNAKALVNLAQVWKTVPDQNACQYESPITRLNPMALTGPVFHNFTVVVNGCSELGSPINFLEHVQVQLTVRLSRRGALKVTLVSPSGTRSELLEGRNRDSRQSFADFRMWPLMSVQFWGENPVGTWSLLVDIHDRANQQFDGTFYGWTLLLYGTNEDPQPSLSPTTTAPGKQRSNVRLKEAAQPTPIVFPGQKPTRKYDLNYLRGRNGASATASVEKLRFWTSPDGFSLLSLFSSIILLIPSLVVPLL